MKKLLSIVLALALVLGNVAVFAANDVNPYEGPGSAGVNLQSYGFVNGYPDKTLKEDEPVTREMLAVLLARLYGEQEIAAAYSVPSGYADEATFPAWSKNQISWVKSKGYMTGMPGNVFDNKGAVKSEDLATVFVRVLGYDEIYGQNAAKLEALTGVKVEGMTLTRGEVFNWMWPVVSTPISADGSVLGVKIGKLPEVKPVAKSVELLSVEATNLKEVMVKFNQEVAKDSVAAANFSLPSSVGKLTTSLSEDGMSVVITVEKALTNQKEYELTAKDVVAANDATQKLAETKTKFKAFDASLPEVLDVQFTGPKNITVTFSEPIKTVGNLSVKAGNTNISANKNSAEGKGTNKIMIPLYSTLTDGTTYTIEVKDFEDYADYKNIVKTVELTYAKDSSAPTVSIETAEQEYVIVEFSKPVTGVDKKNFSHTFSAYKAVKLVDMDGNTITPSTYVSKAKVVFYENSGDKALAEGDVKVMILGKADTQIKDLWGNKLADVEFTVKVSADKNPPEVKEVKATGKTTFTVEFTKPVSFESKHVEVLDKDGKKITGMALTVGTGTNNNKKYTVTSSKTLEGSSYIINISGAKDKTVNETKMVDYSMTLDFKDMSAPEISSASYVAKTSEAPGYVYVFFSEDMDSETALTKSNYNLIKNSNSSLKGFANAPEFYNGMSTVRIVLKDDETVDISSYSILVSNVKDTAGNLISGNKQTFSPYSGNVNPKLNSSKAIATDARTIVAEFSAPISKYDQDKIVLSDSAKIASVEISGKKLIIKLTADMAGAGTASATQQIKFEEGAVESTLGGKNAEISSAAVKDEIQPEFKSIKALADGKFEIEFTRVLTTAGKDDFKNDLVIIAPNGTKLSPADSTNGFVTSDTAASTAKLIVTTKGTGKKDGTYTVSTNSSVYNIKTGDNVIKNFDNKTVTLDVTAPTVSSVTGTGTDEDPIVVTFSEEMQDDTLKLANFTFTDSSGTAAIKTVTKVDGNKSVKIVLKNEALGNNDTLEMTANLKDKAGNAVTAKTYKYTSSNTWAVTP